MKALIRLHGCAGWSGPSLYAYAQRQVFAWHSPFKKWFQVNAICMLIVDWKITYLLASVCKHRRSILLKDLIPHTKFTIKILTDRPEQKVPTQVNLLHSSREQRISGRYFFLFLHENLLSGVQQDMFSWRNKKNVNTVCLKELHYLELCTYHTGPSCSKLNKAVS